MVENKDLELYIDQLLCRRNTLRAEAADARKEAACKDAQAAMLSDIADELESFLNQQPARRES